MVAARRRPGLDAGCRPAYAGTPGPAPRSHSSNSVAQQRADREAPEGDAEVAPHLGMVDTRAASSPPRRRSESDLVRVDARRLEEVHQHAGLMFDAMIDDFERATGPWHAEWMTIPDSLVLTAGALHTGEVRAGRADPGRSADAGQLAVSKRLIVAEAVTARHRLRDLPRGERGRQHVGRGPGAPPGTSTGPPSSG